MVFLVEEKKISAQMVSVEQVCPVFLSLLERASVFWFSAERVGVMSVPFEACSAKYPQLVVSLGRRHLVSAVPDSALSAAAYAAFPLLPCHAERVPDVVFLPILLGLAQA